MKKPQYVFIYVKSTRTTLIIKITGKSVPPKGYVLHSFKEVNNTLEAKDFIARTLRKSANAIK